MVGNKRTKPDDAGEDAAFPRGGGSILTPLEERKLALQAQADFAKESAEGTGKRKKSKKSSPDEADEESFFKAQTSAGRVPKFVELTRFSNISVGAKIWGTVIEVTAKRLVVSLPHGIRGYVAPPDASDVLRSLLNPQTKQDKLLVKAAHGAVPSLTDLFYPGQFVRCVVARLEDGESDQDSGKGSKKGKSKKIHLSTRLSAVADGLDKSSFLKGAMIPAAIRTVEDHGFTMDVGVAGVSAFLSKSVYAAAFGAGAAASPGYMLQAVVKESKRGGTNLVLDCDAGAVASAVTQEFHGVSLGSLLPGQLVTVTVRNILSDGLLVSFLKYFHGTIDEFHLPTEKVGSWKSTYQVNQRLQARILYVDPESKQVRLSLLKNLVGYHLPETLPTLGEVYEDSKVVKAYKNLGLIVQLPTAPLPSLGFVHISNVTEEKTEANLAKRFPSGTAVKARVIGFRPMDAMATLTLRESAMTSNMLSWSSITAGMVLDGTIHSIEDFGVVVQLSGSIRGVVPMMHVSEAAAPKKIKGKFKIGQVIRTRIVNVDSKSRKVTLTLKRGLIDSKMPPLVSKEGLQPGTRAHGFVTGVSEKGVFVEFFNKIKGLVAPSEANLASGQAIADAYTTGQVIKCTVVGVDPKKGLRLSLRSGAAAEAATATVDPLGGIQPGQVFTDVRVTRVVPSEADAERASACFLEIEAGKGVKVAARMAASHFSDHPHAADAIAAALQVGSILPKVLVLERREQANLLAVTCKHEMLAAAEGAMLPLQFTDLREGLQAPGYVASVTQDACYVRFGGSLTGRAGLPHVSDSFVSNPAAHFQVGQSVHAHVLTVDAAAQRFTVSLKPSMNSRPNAALLASLFRDVKLAAELAQESGEGAPVAGSVINVVVSEQRDYGFICDIEGDDKLVGLITPAQVQGPSPVVGQRLPAVVLDVQVMDGIVDLSAKEVLVKSCKQAAKQRAAQKALKIGDSVEATVELVKQDAMCLVASLSGHNNLLAYASSCDFNVQHANMTRTFAPGQRIAATVAQVSAAGHILLHVPLATITPSVKSKGRSKPGAVLHARVMAVHATHADMQAGKSKGRLHVTELKDWSPDLLAKEAGSQPLSSLEKGQEIEVAVLGQPAAAGAKLHRVLELSSRESTIQAAKAGSDIGPVATWESIAPGAIVAGVIQEAAADHVYVVLSPSIRGRVHVLHASSDPADLNAFKERFKVGALVRATVMAVDAEHQRLDLSLLQDERCAMLPKGANDPKAGQLVMGQVMAASGRGLRVQLANGSYAAAALTDLHDDFVPNALQGLRPKTFVRGRVLAAKAGGSGSVALSLKQQDGGKHAGHAQPSEGALTPNAGSQVTLRKGDMVHAYVKSAQPAGSKGAGVYVTLASGQDARVKLSMLSDHYVDDPVTAFPAGKHVAARVLEVSGGHVELTLKSTQTGSEKWQTLSALQEGQVVSGRVKRVEKFGVFVSITDSMLTGLAHISELADSHVKDPASRFAPGAAVQAVVLRKDEARGKISLGLKPSYFAVGAAVGLATRGAKSAAANAEAGDAEMAEAGDPADVDLDALMSAAYDESDDDEGDAESDDSDDDGEEEEEEEAGDAEMVDVDADAADSDDEDDSEDDADSEEGEEQGAVSAAASTSAATDGWDAFMLGDDDVGEEAADEANVGAGLSKRAKKRAREQKELAIRQQELARVEDAAPASSDDFERLVLGSPNSSFVWIRYMAFLLNMAEVEKARAVAERALKTIDYREQNEKFNVWLAWLNLENAYANNPEEAAEALLQRALQYNDAKKMYLAAIDIFANAGRDELKANCLKSVRRKFGGSCKVWLKIFQQMLADGKDPASVLDRATKSLPTRKHVKFLSKAALMELKQGSQDRGRSMYENLLRTYPKRSDLWGVYIDQEIKAGNQASIRNLFERAIHLSLPPKKMKFFFKRYVDYETRHGTESSVAYVKKRALEYIQGLQSSAE